MKPEFNIDISEGGKSALEALQILSVLDPSEGYHISNDLRPPLGIYNTSISRICDKLTKCCIKLEAYFNFSIKVDELRRKDDLREEVLSSSLPEPVCEDPDDDKFLACALASKTKLIISGDEHLLRASGYRGIEVIRPRKFVDKYL
jgi:Predicted nucleic acid-binding protein, contains PIN domain